MANKQQLAPDLVRNVRALSFRTRLRPLTLQEIAPLVKNKDVAETAALNLTAQAVVERQAVAEFATEDAGGVPGDVVEHAAALGAIPDAVFDGAAGGTARERFDDTLVRLLDYLRAQKGLDR